MNIDTYLSLADYASEEFPKMPNCDPQYRMRYALYCDSIFQNHACLFNRPLGDLDDWNAALFCRYNSMRTCIKHAYAHYKNMFKIFSHGSQLNLMCNADAIQRLIVVSFFIFNCKTCMTGSNTTMIYDILPPTIKEYLPLGEVLEPAPIVVA